MKKILSESYLMDPLDLIAGELYWLESHAVAYRWIWDMTVVTNTGGGSALKRAETKDPCLFIEKKTIKSVGRHTGRSVDKGQNIFFGGFDEDEVWNITSAKEPRQPF